MSAQKGPGRLVAVVGPSGVGKDTLIAALARARPDFKVAQRIITRGATAGGEDHLSVSDPLFDAQLAMGRYAFHWHAHGLRYAIPASINADLAQGRTVVFNGSRKALDEIRQQYGDMCVLMITAPPDLLAARLRARGRESAREIAARLKRAELDVPEGAEVIINDGSVDAALAQILASLSRPTQSA